LPGAAGAGRLRTNILAARATNRHDNTREASETPSTDRPAESLSSETSGGPTQGSTDSEEVAPENDLAKKEDKPPKGYKNIPSLDAITERMRARSLSQAADSNTGSSKRETSKTGEEDTQSEDDGEKSIGDNMATDHKGEHPLQHKWTMYHDCKRQQAPPSADPTQTTHPHLPPGSTDTGTYEAGLTVIGEFDTVESFCRYFNWLRPPSQLERNSNYHLFKDGIKPMWEDPANANGGKWVLTMKSNPQLLDKCWSWLVMALVGEELDERDEICGAVASLRAKIDRIQVWTRGKDDVERINSIGRKLVKILDVQNEPGIGLEFQYNTDERPTHSKFISISQPSYYRPTPTTPQSFQGGTPTPTTTGGSGWRTRGSRGGFGVGGGGGAFGAKDQPKEPQTANPFTVGTGDKLEVPSGHTRAHSVSEAQ
jgi:translation initiation factor 4E